MRGRVKLTEQAVVLVHDAHDRHPAARWLGLGKATVLDILDGTTEFRDHELGLALTLEVQKVKDKELRRPLPKGARDYVEIPIRYLDVIGRPRLGWLANSVAMKKVDARTVALQFRSWLGSVGTSALDDARQLALRKLIPDITSESAPARFPVSKEKKMGTAAKEAPTKKSNGKAIVKKSAEPAAETRASAGETIGQVLVKLMKGRDGVKLAARLAKGEDLSKKQLGELRDAVNAAAAAAREADNGKLSSQLSAANRLVRRLFRDA